jgi:hypothetical protein
MRMTASWFRSMGSTEYKDVARDHCASRWAGSPQIVLSFARCWANARWLVVDPDAPEPAALLAEVKEWPGNDVRGERFGRRPSLTSAARGGHRSPREVGTKGWLHYWGPNKRIRKGRKDAVVQN